MEWFFQGLGTLIVGILLGATGDRLILNASRRRNQRQSQKAGHHATLTQVGRDQVIAEDPRRKPAQDPAE